MLVSFVGIFYLYMLALFMFTLYFQFFKMDLGMEFFILIFYFIEINLFIWILTFNLSSFFSVSLNLSFFFLILFMGVVFYLFICEGIMMKMSLDYMDLFFIFLNFLFEMGYLMIMFSS